MNFFWFRRDLRLNDNAGLYHALKSGPVQCLFIFDTNILDKLEDKKDRRVSFIYHALDKINSTLRAHGSSLLIRQGDPAAVWNELTEEFEISSVFCNHDYEPYARKRDETVEKLLGEKKIQFRTFKDQVIFERDEIIKDDGTPYLVYTPYMKKWRNAFTQQMVRPFPVEKYFNNFEKSKHSFPPLSLTGFVDTGDAFPEPALSKKLISGYEQTRNIPSIQGTSRISVHLRFGTVSIRELVRFAWPLNDKFINELIWREFYMMILWHFPFVAERSFKSAMQFLPWKHDEENFGKWCEGRTGYAIVDAGMNELNATGFMHNRVRMITAMFLTKYLLIDWRWGEAYFAKKLLDFELSSNNGGWQWCAGTGVDAAPYFRIFNMDEQTKKFDPQLKYIGKWVPGFQDLSYPEPIVDYAFARKRCLEFFKQGTGEI